METDHQAFFHLSTSIFGNKKPVLKEKTYTVLRAIVVLLIY